MRPALLVMERVAAEIRNRLLVVADGGSIRQEIPQHQAFFYQGSHQR